MPSFLTVGASAGQPWMSVARRDGMAGAGSHHKSVRTRRVTGEGERGREEEERGRGRGREERGGGERRQDGRKEGGGLSGQMNKNREVCFHILVKTCFAPFFQFM